jgi:hypothetical protein
LFKSYPLGVWRGHNWGNHFYIYIGKYLKIFFSRTTEPEKFKFTWKLPDIVQIQICPNECPRGSGGATIGEIIFTCVYIGKIFENLFLKKH